MICMENELIVAPNHGVIDDSPFHLKDIDRALVSIHYLSAGLNQERIGKGPVPCRIKRFDQLIARAIKEIILD